MGRYTTFLEDFSYDIFPEDEGYEDKLIECAGRFRPFDEAMDAFICDHGYEGNVADIDEKVKYIASRFKEAGIKPPRSLKKWFTEDVRAGRGTAFEICFAFGLDLKESNDFFRRVYLGRGFDGHDMAEIVYMFALDHGISYEKASDMVRNLPAPRERKEPGKAVIYTEAILEDIDDIDDADALVSYLSDHKSSFGYNNATACSHIRKLWEDIAGSDGLAVREKKEFYIADEYLGDDGGKKGDGKKEIRADKKDSLWKVYLQILGLTGDKSKKLGSERTIKPLLKDAKIIHPLAEDSFPDRDGLNKILNHEHVSYERVRKMLILLTFYHHWVSRKLERGTDYVRGGDTVRFIDYMDNELLDVGYPELYVGNPYDWLIMYSLVNSDDPLGTFREYMLNLYYTKFDD